MNERIDNITWLAKWYGAQCDGDWEHSYGVTIETLDNPGWSIKVDLRDTDLEGKTLEPVASNMAGSDGDASQRWHHCKVEADCFEGSGGVDDLTTMIGVFRDWAERSG